MKKTKLFALVVLLAMCGSLALATEAPTLDMGAMQSDSDTFFAHGFSANWTIPEGYTLEKYLLSDLSGDGHDDALAASLLAADGAHRMLSVILSNPLFHHVYTSTTALPAKAENDTFLGFSMGDGTLNVHVGDNETDHYSSIYSFGLHGQLFYLDTVRVQRWDPATMAATEDVFRLDRGEHAAYSGTKEGEAFVSQSTTAEHTFDAHQSIFVMEEFDIAQFPLTWDAFNEMIRNREIPHPTNQPTRHPRPTRWPQPTSTAMPGPVYPTDMPIPDPVYPTDMPGPVYPTEPIPGPVYPTEPIYMDGVDANGE